MISDKKSNIDIALLIKCALEAGATIIKNDAGLSAGIYVKGEPFDINNLFKNCQGYIEKYQNEVDKNA